ncbi:MAG: type 2 isopentenyl-diphosphate Delta-isomerase [Actinobacteria bacterium]|nr:type 2 isopentenyl-diphosphate Delta-isomerase [Actinomycetota bacterium]
MSGEIRKRKAEHLELAGSGPVEPPSGPGWDDVELVHEALPEVAADEVELGVELLGRRLQLPLVIAGMTGGHPGAAELNAALGRAAERHGCAVGVGSQRAALLDPSLEPTYAALREAAPGAFLIANIGAAQLIPQGDRPALGRAEVERLIAMVDADALAVHLNFLEEAVQPEGDRAVRGCAEAIAALADGLPVPLIVKETGAGMHEGTARRLAGLGADALDVGGAGGTSFALVERLRAERQGDARGVRLGSLLGDWGIPTAAAVASCSRAGLPVIATGGVRSGLDAAKALALGATAVGVARPLLQAAQSEADGPSRWVDDFALELRTVLMLTGCRRATDLAERPRVLGGRVGRWIEALERAPLGAAP